MADDGYPYPGVSQITTAAEWEGYFSAAQLDGVTSGLTPTINSGARTASVGAGGAWLRGFFKPVSSTAAKAVPAASAQDRVDRLVVRLDRDAATSATYIVPTVLTGTAGTTTPPALTRGTTGAWDLPISRWTSKADGSLTGMADERYGPGWHTSAARTGGLVSASPARASVEVDTGQVYRSDGSAWASLGADTGWVNLTLNGPDGHVWTLNNLARVRALNGNVHFRAYIRRNDGIPLPTTDDGSRVLTLPPQFCPTVTEWVGAYHSRAVAALRIEPSGEVRVYAITADIPGGRTVQATGEWMLG